MIHEKAEFLFGSRPEMTRFANLATLEAHGRLEMRRPLVSLADQPDPSQRRASAGPDRAAQVSPRALSAKNAANELAGAFCRDTAGISDAAGADDVASESDKEKE